MLRSGKYIWDDSNQCWNASLAWGRRFFSRREALRFREERGLTGVSPKNKVRAEKVELTLVSRRQHDKT